MTIGNKRKSSFYHILAFNYILFTVLVLLVFFSIYQGYILIARRIAPIPNVGGLLEAAEGTDDTELSKINVSQYLGESYSLDITDRKGNVLYSQGDGGENRDSYKKEVLECIPEYFSDVVFLAAELPEESDSGAYIVTRLKLQENGEDTVTGYLLLDRRRNVLSGNLFPGKTAFSQEEFLYLKGIDGAGKRVYRHVYENGRGEERQLIFRFIEPSHEDYQRAYEVWNHIWWIFIPAYLCIAGICIYFLSRKTKRLLKPLNEAIVGFKEGGAGSLAGYRGPDEFMEIANNFIRMEEQLKKSSEERRRMLADISHDLKTPVTVIRGYATALRDKIVPTGQEPIYLNTIVEKTEKIQELLSAFHEYSKLDHPDMEGRMEKEDVCEVCREYLAGRHQELELKGIGLEADIPEEKVFCMLDRRLFFRALDNILNNSLAYGGRGITIFASLKREKERVTLMIADDGKGVPEELADKIFQPFVTGDASRGDGCGSGLGLSIVKQIFELHGGSIRLVYPPEKGYGAQFAVTLPALKDVKASTPKAGELRIDKN